MVSNWTHFFFFCCSELLLELEFLGVSRVHRCWCNKDELFKRTTNGCAIALSGKEFFESAVWH